MNFCKKANSYPFILLIMSLLSACNYDIEAPADKPFGLASCPQGCDSDFWDADGDCIDNNLELNPTNYNLYGFHVDSCDNNPSQAIGMPNHGSLEGGINLTDSEEGYYHFLGSDQMDTDDWGTLALCKCIQKTGRDWGIAPPRMGVGDMSLQNGGYFPPHGSHQNGIDVDMRYVRSDEVEDAMDIASSHQRENYDTTRTMGLFVAFIENCNVTDIFCDISTMGFTNEDLAMWADKPNINWMKYSSGHTDHFHVRIAQPQ
jgi:murein endopeptidase